MMPQRITLLAILAMAAIALGVEESDVLLFVPFERTANAALSTGAGAASLVGPERFDAGVRGGAIILGRENLLSYAFADNCVPDEGTIMMWAKPQWRSDDGDFHYLFRASTGHYRGKALNALMLYEYRQMDRLLFYSSDHRETAPQEGRSLAYKEPAAWEPDRWYHVAATWSATLANTEQVLYIDGRRASSASGAVFVPVQSPERIEIGGPRGTSPTWFDDLIVFSRPLLAAEVASIYDSYRKIRESDPSALPFVSRRELQLRPYVLPGRRQLVVEVDYRGARKDLGVQAGTVELTLVKSGQAQTERQVADPAIGATRFVFDEKKIGEGLLQVRATLRDNDARTLRTGELDYTVPAKPIWLGNDVGTTDAVLAPWEPLRVEGDTVHAWGREYVFQSSPLPVQIVTQQSSLLRDAVSLRLVAGQRDCSLQAVAETTGARLTGNGAKVEGLWKGSLGPLACQASSAVELDGFMRIDLVLRPTEPVEIDALEMVVPFTGAAATLYHHANGTWTELSDAGGIGEVGWSKPLPFVPYVWVGSERGGLAWCCESSHHWHNACKDRVLEIVRTEEGVDLRVRVIDTPTTISEPLRLSIGLMATPVKPMPAGWRDWRPVFISAVNLEAFAKRGPRVAGCRNIGTLWNTHVGAFSYLPARPSEMRQKVRLLKEHGWETVLSYFALDYTQVGTPEYRQAEREWRRNPYSESGLSYGSYGTVCNASSWADFLVWAINETMDATGTDGVYLDCCNPNFCRSREHGCEPGRYPIFATRDLMKRIYTLVREKRGANGFVYAHNSENNIITTFSFTDAVLNGEQYNRKDLAALTPAKFRAELCSQPYGVPAVLLPTLVKFQPEGREKMPGSEFLAFPLLHDVLCASSWLGKDSQALLRRIQQVMQEWGVGSAEFLPYWDNATELSVASDGARVSAYLHADGNSVLLVAMAERSLEATVTFQGRLVSLVGGSASEPFTGQSLWWTGSTLHWPLPARQLCLTIVSAEP